MIKSFDYDKLQARLAIKANRNPFPIRAMFEVTYRCNLKCRHCYVVPIVANQGRESRNERRKELDTKQVFDIFDQLASAGCLNLGFTGGEPFLRKDIFAILEYAKKKGFNSILLTNATLITPQAVDKLKEIGLNKIDISFHSTKKEIFDWFSGVNGTYAKVLNATKLLRDKGIEVYFKTTLMTINKDEILRIRHLAVEKFGAHFRWAPILTPSWDGKKENLKFRLTAEELNQVSQDIQRDTEIETEKSDPLVRKSIRPKRKKTPNRKINHDRLFRCQAGRTEVVINPYGQMRLCPDIHYPNYQILKGSFAQGWEMLSNYARNATPGSNYQCRDCEVVQYCNVCPAVRWLECEDFSACPTYYKQIAQLSKIEALG